MDNATFFSLLAIVNIPTAIIIFVMLFSKFFDKWNQIEQFGFGIAAAGLIGQVINDALGTPLDAPWYHQYWVLKDVGLFVFTMGWLTDYIKQHASEELETLRKENANLRALNEELIEKLSKRNNIFNGD